MDEQHEVDGMPSGRQDGADEVLADVDDAASLDALVEAVLFVADEPLSAARIAAAVAADARAVEHALDRMRRRCAAPERGIEPRFVAGGWRLYTKAQAGDPVARFVRDGQNARLTQAALETLAIVAYRQPVGRGRVSAIRGVNSDGVVRTLIARGLIVESGTDPGSGAHLLVTTAHFLEKLGLASLDELPDLGPYLPSAADVAAGLDLG